MNQIQIRSHWSRCSCVDVCGCCLRLTVVMLLIGPTLLGEGVIALLYLVPIGWCTVRWGQLAGVSAALTAALSFDFLFIPPYGTFNIGSLEGWLLAPSFYRRFYPGCGADPIDPDGRENPGSGKPPFCMKWWRLSPTSKLGKGLLMLLLT